MGNNLFDPRDLVPVKSLCEAGEIPLSYDRARKLCQTDRLPGIKIANQWHTTRLAARGYLFRGANKAFRRLHA